MHEIRKRLFKAATHDMISLWFLLLLAIIFNYNEVESEEVAKSFFSNCGTGKSLIQSNTSTSNDVNLGEFPWLVTILRYDKSEDRWIRRCQGSIIHPNVVLTSAACAG